MGYAARLNPRSPAGGKPKAFCSLHRTYRAVQFFGDDREAFVRWVDGRDVNDQERAMVELVWSDLHPPPLVTFETAIARDLIAHG